MENNVLSGHPSEPIFEDFEALALAAPSEWFSIGFKHPGQRPLISFQYEAGDLPCPREISFIRPGQETFKFMVAGLKGVFGIVAGCQGFKIVFSPQRQAIRLRAIPMRNMRSGLRPLISRSALQIRK